MIAECEKQINKLRTLIIEKVQGLDKKYFEMLKTIPGFGELWAAIFLIELGEHAFLESFQNEDKFFSWLGVCPGNNESAGKRKSGGCRKGNLYLRRALCEVAQAAVRTKKTTFKSKYDSLSIRLVRKRSIFAIAHKIMRVVFKILSQEKMNKDPQINYQQLSAQKLTPRWLRNSVKFQIDWQIEAVNKKAR